MLKIYVFGPSISVLHHLLKIFMIKLLNTELFIIVTRKLV